jgi:hypothetical protein
VLLAAAAFATSVRANAEPPSSPFGFHPASVAEGEGRVYTYAQDIGVGWSREGVYAFWELADQGLNGWYDFNGFVDPKKGVTINYDTQWSAVPPDVSILANISDKQSIPFIQSNPVQYADFVYRLVERYDGDGDLGCTESDGFDCYNPEDGQHPAPAVISAMAANPIKYWQVGNQIGEDEAFAQVQELTYQAVKRADPTALVLMGGDGGNYDAVLTDLGGEYIDIFDWHYFGDAFGDYRARFDMDELRAMLQANGYPADLPVWVTETGTFTGQPRGHAPQTERQQAIDLLKRYVYLGSQGVEKVFWAYGLKEPYGIPDDNDFWDGTGLIYDGYPPGGEPPEGTKKLSYYTYKKMTDVLAAAEWATLTMLHDGTEGDYLYLFRLMRSGQPIHIAWWDTFDEPGCEARHRRELAVTGLTGSRVRVTSAIPMAPTGGDVTDYATAFAVRFSVITDQTATVSLGEDPVFIELVYDVFLPMVLKSSL